MRRIIVVGLVVGLMVLGSAMVSIAQEGPKLEKIWAPAEFNYGSVVKIYLKASDPTGDMKFLLVTAGGAGITKPVGFVMIRLKKGLGNELNGYVYWDSSRSAVKAGSTTVEIIVEDRKGNESEAKSVDIKMVPQGAKAEERPADFQEVEIGPITIYNIRRVTP
jgi:hypothetical protein